MRKYRLPILVLFGVLTILAAIGCFRLRDSFKFDFRQFFPQGDEDLAYFLEFIEDFEGDDNFMLVAFEREEGVFDSTFLADVHDFSIAARGLPQVDAVQSLTQFAYPLKTPFGLTTIPAIHLDQPSRYEADRERILNDERFVYNLINEDGTALVVALKTTALIQLEESRELMSSLNELVANYDLPEYHYLGPAYFQVELVEMQIREITVSALVSGFLVMLIMFIIFRRPLGVTVALVSIALGLLLFMGLLGWWGRDLTAIAALYPVLMIIVGTSDVIHIMSKYIDELRNGKDQETAIKITIKEIGLATLLTSVTTAVGFATLITSRIGPIRDFGMNAAIGVLVAYVTVILFTTALLSYLKVDQIVKLGRGQAFWDRLLNNFYQFSRRRTGAIKIGAFVVAGLCALGISMITTNYRIETNLPRNRAITEDYLFFEKQLGGFRPHEMAIQTVGDSRVTDFEVMQEIGKVEDYVKSKDQLRATASITTVYRSLNQMYNNNRPEAYTLPDDPSTYARYQRLAERIPPLALNLLVNPDGTKARISSRLTDTGADSIKSFMQRTDDWVAANIDSSLISVKQTGTGVIIDKNAEYIRRNLLQGLALAIVIVCILMALLFRNWRMLLISLVPNIFPLLIAGALLGYVGIELEAGVSIVFAVIFGIAVDDTIHFLSKYKLARNKGLAREEAVSLTFRETGKAIMLTSVVLFFGFLVMLFSIHPPSVTIGLLISLTLASALLSDLLLIPILLKWVDK
ncbi:MAG: MMPL family transporter [Bacteroidota bacterium]